MTEPKLKILSIRATATKACFWKAQAYARGMTIQSLVVNAIEDYITRHPLTTDQQAAYLARFEQLREEVNKHDRGQEA